VTLDLKAVRYEVDQAVALITLDRPDRLNAWTVRMAEDFHRAIEEAAADDGVGAIVVTGAGRGFCPGADSEALGGLAGGQPYRDAAVSATVPGTDEPLDPDFAHSFSFLLGVEKPVIAAVNGPAAGGGLSLALAADIRLAAPSATFNAAFVRIGLSAGDLGASWLLTRLIGPGHAAEIAYTGRLVPADEALTLGLVNSISPAAELLDDALALGRAIVANSPGGVQLSKRALQANMETASYAAALELENRGQALLTRTEDMAEALAAVKDKRAPVFTGR
jgi:enoyl-CoA hydratase/carnithine racemase